MYSSLYVYPWDVLDETPQAFCEALPDLLGVDTISLAVSYHAGKLLLPHNPRRKVYYPEDGALFFQPDLTAFAHSVIKPHVSTLAQAVDPLAALCQVAEQAQLEVIAWTVTLHNTRLGLLYPEYTPRNAFGDSAIMYLCPAHPEVQAYICALSADLARRYPLRAIQLEALHFMPFVHGFHHEMQQMTVTPALQVLLGLCFCDACLARARAARVDGERVRAFVAQELEARLLVEREAEGEEAWLQPFWGACLEGELERYIALRSETIAHLWSEVSQAVHAVSHVQVHLQDPSAAGVDRFSAADLAWLSGLEIPPRAGMADGVTLPGYIADLAVFQREIDLYCSRVLPVLPLEIGLRPALPDCRSSEDLAAKVAYCAERGVTGVSFYNYGMLPLSRLRWIRDALASLKP